MGENVSELNEDKGYQAFSNLMDAVFELCVELREKYHKGLSEAEVELLDAMDEYVQYELEQQENEES